MDWSALTPEQQFTAIVAFFSACLGGGISLVVSVVITWISQRSESKKRELEKAHELRSKAYAGLIKLSAIANSFYSTKAHIEAEFEAAGDARRKNDPPCMIVRPIVGASDEFPALEAAELYFLFEAGSAELINEAMLVELRLKSNNAGVIQYNNLKYKLTEFIEAHAKVDRQTGDLAFDIIIEPEYAGFFSVQIATLNDLLNTIIASADRDLADSIDVLQRYQEIAERHFSDHGFPKIKVGEVTNNASS